MTPWWIYVLLVFAIVCLLGVPVSAYLERRSDQHDRELWNEQPGATR